MGSSNSQIKHSKSEKEKLKDQLLFLKYTKDRRVESLLKMQNIKQKPTYLPQESQIQSSRGCLFGCVSSSRKRQNSENIAEINIQSWLLFLLENCHEYQDSYEWARQIYTQVKAHLNSKRFSPQAQRRDQNQLIWNLTSMQHIDMQNNFDQNQRELNPLNNSNQKTQKNNDLNDFQDMEWSKAQLSEKNSKDEEEIEIQEEEEQNQQQTYQRKISTRHQDDFLSQAIKQTELFIEDIQPSHPSNNSQKINKIDHLKKELNPSSVRVTRSYSQLQKQPTVNIELENTTETQLRKTSEIRKRAQTQRIQQNSLDELKKNYFSNTTVITNQSSQAPLSRKDKFKMVKTIGFYKQTTKFFEQQFKDKKHLFYFLFKEFRTAFIEYYQHLFQEIIMSKELQKQQEKLKQKQLQVDKNNSINRAGPSQSNQSLSQKSYLKESQIKIIHKKHIHESYTQNQSLIQEKMTESIANLQEFCDEQPKDYTSSLDQKNQTTNINSSSLRQSIMRGSMMSSRRASVYQNLNLNEDEDLPESEIANLEFKDYYDLAVDEIKDFLEILVHILFEYYNIYGLSEYKYGKFLQEENVYNFVASFIIDEQIQSILLQYCQKIHYENEHKYNKQIELFQSVTPSQLGIRSELEQISKLYYKSQQQTKEQQQQDNDDDNNNKNEDSLMYQDIIKLFKMIEYISSPIHKLKLLVQCNELIEKEIINYQQKINQSQIQKGQKEINLDGDDIMNAYIYIIGKSGVSNLFSQLQLIESFMSENQATSHSGYFFTTTYSAVQYLLNFNKSQLQNVQNIEEFKI